MQACPTCGALRAQNDADANVVTPKAAGLRLVARIAAEHGVTVADITGDSRTARVSRARQHAWYALREAFGWSYPRLARFFNRRDHTTAHHGVRAHRQRLADEQSRAA